MKFLDDVGNMLVFDIETTDDISGGGEKLPVKLGDGNFGCVLAARGGNQLLALKIIYQHQATTGNGSDGELDYKLSRTLAELRVREVIFDKLDKSHDKDIRSLTKIYDEHLVLPLAYTHQWTTRSSDQFKSYNINP